MAASRHTSYAHFVLVANGFELATETRAIVVSACQHGDTASTVAKIHEHDTTCTIWHDFFQRNMWLNYTCGVSATCDVIHGFNFFKMSHIGVYIGALSVYRHTMPF